MKKDLTYSDALLNPRFSEIESRADVDLSNTFLGISNTLPIINANMDTIASSNMAAAMATNGAIGALHRFYSIDENIKDFKETLELQKIYGSMQRPFVTLGISDEELERALALYEVGATRFIIDVAHGASIGTVRQYDKLREKLKDNAVIVVGNFANAESIKCFNEKSQSIQKMDAAKVGIGGGSMCTTRIVTGCGRASLSSIIDSVQSGVDIIADGGLKTSGDISKALAAGAKAVMLGGMLAGTEESPGELLPNYIKKEGKVTKASLLKVYRGSASKESYEAQGKTASHRTPEGESTTVPYKGPVSDVLQQIEAGIRSSMSYVGARNLQEFREKAEFVEITNSGWEESKAHGKK